MSLAKEGVPCINSIVVVDRRFRAAVDQHDWRIVLGTAETEISAKFAEAAKLYNGNPIALHLRAMNMLYEAMKEKGAMVVVPSTAFETMGLGGILGTTALATPPNPVV